MVLLTEIPHESSSSLSTYDYDVFVSFRGFDTRYTFTDHLYHALVDADITTFLDDTEIQTGEDLKTELKSAIKASRASVIVLSKNYASSTWCMDELVLILEQRRNFNQIVVPIFYDVEPTDIRKQRNSFGDAMADHKRKMDAETNADRKALWAQKIERWNMALTEITDIKGKDAKGRKETEFIEEIVAEIHLRLAVPLSNTLPLLIGRNYFVEVISSWLTDGSCQTGDILSVSGMGGIGKTSLAKYVFGLYFRTFQKSSFVEDISRRCDEQYHGLLDLQKQLYGDISKKSSIQVRDVSVYTAKIGKTLARTKVLIVLDDIDSLDQLDALLGNKGFHLGSKIIIITKDASLTERCSLFNLQVQPKHTKVLLTGLCETESLKLLCHNAFKCEKPKEGYKEVSKELVKYCEGHPLALEVLGKSLHNRDVAEWEYYIAGIKKEPHSRIRKALQMSFDSLPFKTEKDLFKHIACFFDGIDRDFTETVLKACGINTTYGIRNLVDRCLLSIGWDNKLKMHQLLQQIGREEVHQESPEKPWKRSRLWCHEESFRVLKQKKGTENLLGVTLDMRMLKKEKLRGSFELEIDALGKMDNLLILHLNYVEINEFYENFPQELRWLCMHGFPLKSIPLNIPMENMVVLDMSYSKIESFGRSHSNPQPPAKTQKLSGSSSKDKRLLGSLKILDLSYCYQLRSVGGFFELPALERLIVRNCISLIEICESIEQCDELVLVDLSYCNEFRKLLRTIDKLKKVKTLSLDGCNLGEFPIDMDVNSQGSSTDIVEAIPRELRSFTISLPSSLLSLSLTNNNLSNDSFPMDLSCLSMLKKLSLLGNPIVSLPNCVRSLPRLESLNMSHCKKLMSIGHPPRTLKQLILYSNFGQRDCTPSPKKIVFDQEMSPLTFVLEPSSIEIEGMLKIEPLARIKGNVLSSLGWSNVDVNKKSRMRSYPFVGQSEAFQIQMYYQFGIFSTIYGGEEMPKWIKHRSKGPSLSFTIPSSPNHLKGLNIFHVHKTRSNEMFEFPNNQSFQLPVIIINNITKKHKWIYHHCIRSLHTAEECLITLSHWMFGVNEMESGDYVTITLKEGVTNGLTIECGIDLVYGDRNITEEEDPLGYYKSWKNIIGGDLSAFQSTTGEFILHNERFGWGCMSIISHTLYGAKI